MAEIDRTGAAGQLREVPAEVRAAFVTALEISPEWHLSMQSAVQRHVDAAVAKTVNLPSEATVADVRATYLKAWESKVKGITIYRDGSRSDQVLTRGPGARGASIEIADDYSGGCEGHVCEF
jgi:ribonucleoside-diphosphate reductase alpha chain